MRNTYLVPPGLFPPPYNFSNATGIVLQATTHQIAYKFYAPAGITVSHVDFFLNQVGTPVGVTLTAELQTSASDVPTTLVGAATAAFAAAGNAWQTERALGTNAVLSINDPYWLVIKVAAATTLDATNHYQAKSGGTTLVYNREKLRQHNGTNWTTTTAVLATGLFVLKDTTGRYWGLPLGSAEANSTRTEVFGTNRQGLRALFGAQVKVTGVALRVTKTGTPPGNLEVVIYEGDTQMHVVPITTAEITSSVDLRAYLAAPVLLAADIYLYAVLRQAGDVGDTSNDYDLRAFPINATYVSALYPADMRMVSGTGDVPSAYTVHDDEAPILSLLIADPATDIDQAASGASIFMHSE